MHLALAAAVPAMRMTAAPSDRVASANLERDMTVPPVQRAWETDPTGLRPPISACRRAGQGQRRRYGHSTVRRGFCAQGAFPSRALARPATCTGRRIARAISCARPSGRTLARREDSSWMTGILAWLSAYTARCHRVARRRIRRRSHDRMGRHSSDDPAWDRGTTGWRRKRSGCRHMY